MYGITSKIIDVHLVCVFRSQVVLRIFAFASADDERDSHHSTRIIQEVL